MNAPSDKYSPDMSRRKLRVQWFRGTGGGGQHRNKHPNCCRIIDEETGLSASGTRARSRTQNYKAAAAVLAARIAEAKTPRKVRRGQEPEERVRSYTGVMGKREFSRAVEKRRTQMLLKEQQDG